MKTGRSPTQTPSAPSIAMESAGAKSAAGRHRNGIDVELSVAAAPLDLPTTVAVVAGLATSQETAGPAGDASSVSPPTLRSVRFSGR